MKITEYALKYAKSDRQIDMGADNVSPAHVMRRIFDENPDAELVVLFCGSRRGIFGYAVFQSSANPSSVALAAKDAKATGVFIGVKVIRTRFDDFKKSLEQLGVEYVNGISMNRDSYYMWEQKQLYRYGD